MPNATPDFVFELKLGMAWNVYARVHTRRREGVGGIREIFGRGVTRCDMMRRGGVGKRTCIAHCALCTVSLEGGGENG